MKSVIIKAVKNGRSLGLFMFALALAVLAPNSAWAQTTTVTYPTGVGLTDADLGALATGATGQLSGGVKTIFPYIMGVVVMFILCRLLLNQFKRHSRA